MTDKIKSPLNYTGGKYKLLPTLLPILAKAEGIHTFVDLFCGGCNVAANTDYTNTICNDYNHIVMALLQVIRSTPTNKILAHIDRRIHQYRLSTENEAGFVRFRAAYNKSRARNPLDLYVLICYSFNYQIRFNAAHEFNNPFGRNRSSFTPTMRDNLVRFSTRLKALGAVLQSQDFEAAVNAIPDLHGVLVYCDPPYLITCAAYNDGKRGFAGWDEKQEQRLLDTLDRVAAAGGKFALSNLLSRGSVVNTMLASWATKYKTTKLSYCYRNCNYQKRADTGVEVLITNYCP